MTIEEICAIVATTFLVFGALCSAMVWLFGVGNKLGGIEGNTKSTAEGLKELNKQMNVHSGQLMEHSVRFDELHGHMEIIREDVVAIRADVTDLQQHSVRK